MVLYGMSTVHQDHSSLTLDLVNLTSEVLLTSLHYYPSVRFLSTAVPQVPGALVPGIRYVVAVELQ